MRRIFLTLLLACFLPAIGQAQHPAGAVRSAAPVPRFSAAPLPVSAAHIAPAHPMMAARPVSRPGRTSTRITAAPKTAAHPMGWNHPPQHVTNPVDPVFPNGNNVTNGLPVPGLGFDYPHYFATHPNAGRCHNCFGRSFVAPFGDGGFFIPIPMYVEQPAEAQPAEPTDAGDQVAQTEEPPEQNYPTPPARVAPQPVPKQQSEYVFVRRDGTLIFAVAYSWINDRLQYVSEEGLRRTVPLNTIDMDATQQFNDQRGVPIRLPV